MRRVVFIILGVLWLADMAAMVALGHLSHYLVLFSILYCLAFILLLALVSSFPEYSDAWPAFWLILVLGMAGRIIFLFYPSGNDIYRYIWEGCIQNQGFNPYGMAPDDSNLSRLAHGELYPIWQHINHKTFSAAYPPLTMLMFRIAAWLNPTPVFFKIAMVLFDVGLMAVLGLILKIRQLPVKRLLLYACNPLVIVFIAGEGHVDGLQVFFLFVGIWLLLSCKKMAGFLSLGLAVMSKYLAGAAVPFFVSGRSRKRWFIVLLPLALFLPYLDAGKKVISSVVTFGTTMHYNDSLFALLRYLFGGSAHLLGFFLLLMCFAWVFLVVHDHLRSVYLAFCCLMVFLPTLHPWYLVLIAPFMVFFPSKAWMYLQAAMVFTFPVMAVDYKTGIFQEIHWLKWLEFGPFFGLLTWAAVRDGQFQRAGSYSPPEDISVIVPTLNEAGSIKRCLTSLQNRVALREVIVTDGGSTDNTCEIAANNGARVVRSQKGRGFQIKAATEAAKGDILLILHADCIIQKGVFSKLIDTLKANPYVAGGACGMQFEKQRITMRIAAWLNNTRAFFTGISFGDQAQFFRTEALDPMGGFPAMMLMEDVELSIRLKQIGRVLYLRNGVLASGRRWKRVKFANNFLTVTWLFTRYLIERRLGKGEVFHQKYYKSYYGSP
jgi:rSAM/selenodomain-associated transferase 2